MDALFRADSPVPNRESRIGGAVVALIDITEQAERQRLDDARVYAESIIDAVRDPMVILDAELRVVSANAAFYRDFHSHARPDGGPVALRLGQPTMGLSRLADAPGGYHSQNAQFDDFEVEHDFPETGHKKIVLNARRIDQAGGRPQLILLAMENVTDGKNRKKDP